MVSEVVSIAGSDDLLLIGLPGAPTRELAAQLKAETATVEELNDPLWRSKARRDFTVVWIDDGDEKLAQRAGVETELITRTRRQMLGPLTTAANAIVVIDESDPSELVGRVEQANADGRAERQGRAQTELVNFDDGRSYPIIVGRGVTRSLADHLPSRARRVAIVTQPGIGLVPETGRDQRVFEVEVGESAKRLSVVEELASGFARWGMNRSDVVVSVGGGVVSDLAGFVASTYHRGIPVIHVSTTLLGQIDAAIGGKCGVNLAEGKNLVGSFWQPTAVFCEIDALDTLPAEQFNSGMGELAKYHFLGGGRLDRVPLVERVAASARIKADVVSGDEREGGRRAILNYGHTLGHALEAATGYTQYLHGQAVAIGLIYAAELALRLGRIDQSRVDEHRRVVTAYGLETEIPSTLDPDELVELFGRDKKALDGITFVLDGPNGVEPVRIDDRALLRQTLEVIRRP